MEEYEEWINKAKSDLKAAFNSLNSKDYDWACFKSQQAIEKALKGMYIKKFHELLKIHDLVLLSKKVSAPDNIIVLCSKINPSYIDTRYPDVFKIYTKEDAEQTLNYSKEVLKWIEKNL